MDKDRPAVEVKLESDWVFADDNKPDPVRVIVSFPMRLPIFKSVALTIVVPS